MEDYAWLCINARIGNVRSSADPDGVSAQIDLIGVPWLNIGFGPSAAQRGGYRARAADQPGHPAEGGVHTARTPSRARSGDTRYRPGGRGAFRPPSLTCRVRGPDLASEFSDQRPGSGAARHDCSPAQKQGHTEPARAARDVPGSGSHLGGPARQRLARNERRGSGAARAPRAITGGTLARRVPYRLGAQGLSGATVMHGAHISHSGAKLIPVVRDLAGPATSGGARLRRWFCRLLPYAF
jgi:hypothetical protein